MLIGDAVKHAILVIKALFGSPVNGSGSMPNANDSTLDTSSNPTSSVDFSFEPSESPPTPKGHRGPQKASTPQVSFLNRKEHEPSCRPKPKNVFKKFRLLAPMNVDAAEKDDSCTETNFWDQVVSLRNVMLAHQDKAGQRVDKNQKMKKSK